MKDIEQLFVERREWPRVALDVLVDRAVIHFPDDPTFQAPAIKVVNLSEGGAGILSPSPVKRGARITLNIAGPQLSPLDFRAEIRWIGSEPVSTGHYAAGLKFIDLDERGRMELRNFMQILRARHIRQS